MTVFCDVAPCSPVEIYRSFRGAYCLHHQGSKAISISETLVNFYEATWRNILEDSHLHSRRRENLKSHYRKAYGPKYCLRGFEKDRFPLCTVREDAVHIFLKCSETKE
jgi:hypothetical protein